MKKILSIVFAALLACLAALCVVGVGKGFLDSTIDAVSPISEASSESKLDDSAQAHSEESSVCFNSMAEYIAYMTEQTNNSASISECSSVASDGNTTVYYYSPDNLPSDYEISNIIVDDTGVTFRFSKVGGVTITSNDKATMSLYNSISTRTYRDMDFITDVPTYAMELAAAIGAHHTGGSLPPSVSSTYSGNVTAYIPDIDQDNATIVGSQNIWIGEDGLVHYNYTPAYTQLSSNDARNYFELVLHTVSGSVTE